MERVERTSGEKVVLEWFFYLVRDVGHSPEDAVKTIMESGPPDGEAQKILRNSDFLDRLWGRRITQTH